MPSRVSGFDRDYITDIASQLNNNSSTAKYARFEQLLTQAAVRFIGHVHYGRVNPCVAGFEFAAPRNPLLVARVAVAAHAMHAPCSR
jgi:hypothetical protein